MEGGLLVTSTKYNECSKDKLYFKPACGNEYPCLNNDTKCYNKNNDVSNNSIPKKLVDEIFSTDGKPVIIKTNSFVDKKFNFFVDKFLNSGGESSVFFIKNLIFGKTNKLIKLSLADNLKRPYRLHKESLLKKQSDILKKAIDDLSKENLSEEILNIKKDKIKSQLKQQFKDNLAKIKNEDKYKDYESLNFQYKISDQPFINKLHDFGRFKIELNNKLVNRDVLNKVEPINCKNINRKCEPININSGSYQIIEKCAGSDLFNKIDKLTRNEDNSTIYLNDKELLKKTFKNLLLGLKTIHDNGFAHLDIKSENIGLTYDSNDHNYLPNIEYLDFGSSKKIGEMSTPKGTLEYMSPDFENIAFINKNSLKKVSDKDDIFSLGITIYEIINYCKPVHGNIIEANKFDNISIEEINNEIILELSILYESEPDEDLSIVGISNKIFWSKPYRLQWISENKFKVLFKNFNETEKKILIANFKKYQRFIVFEYEQVRSSSLANQIDIFKDQNLDEDFVDLLENMLEIDEDDRYNVDDALNHKYFYEEDTLPPKKIKLNN